LESFRVFINELDHRVDNLIDANQDPAQASGTGIVQAKKYISDATMSKFDNSVSNAGTIFSSNREKFVALVSFMNTMLIERESFKLEEDETVLDFDFGHNSSSKKGESLSKEKPNPKPRNGEGHGNNGNGGKKGASDKPGWKNVVDSNFSSFEKKGPRSSGTAGDKPLPEKDYCVFHAPSAKHSPMECRAPLDKKKLMLQKNGGCYNCLGKGHRSSKCYFAPGCTDCNQAHHPSLCAKNQKNPSSGNNGKPSYGGKNGKPGPAKGKGGKPYNNQQKGKKKVQFNSTEEDESESEEKTMNQRDKEINERNGMVIRSNLKNGANTSVNGSSR
jgi:hypothetical protein